MTEYKVKLVPAFPKGEGNGFDYTIAVPMGDAGLAGKDVPPGVALLVYGLKDAKRDKDGVITAAIEVRRIEPVTTETGRRLVEQLLVDEFSARTGEAALPYDLSALSKALFADLPRSIEETDRIEAGEQDLMSPTDELRRHLERVHGHEDAGTYTAEEAEEKHRADHDGSVLGPLEHNRDWFGWTRADLEAAADEGAEDSSAWRDDESEPGETSVVRAEHSFQADAGADDRHRAVVIGNADDHAAAARMLEAADNSASDSRVVYRGEDSLFRVDEV